ncbi:MAG: hypothetical protein PHQ22_10815 [Sulfuricurvum sp.]|nr:hypothetical protein [Sulfuricurvum sp.]
MYTGTLYLNNSGHRWINLINGKRDKITLFTKNGKEITRTVNYWQAFGNFATANISYKNKRINVFADTILED